MSRANIVEVSSSRRSRCPHLPLVLGFAAVAWASTAHAITGTSLCLDASLQTSCGDTLGGACDVTQAWRSAMSSGGVSLATNDGTLFWTEFADVSIGGTDDSGGNIDDKQLVAVATHGFDSGGWKTMSEFKFYLSSKTDNPSNNCSVPENSMKIGRETTGGTAKFFTAFACFSNQVEWLLNDNFGWDPHGFLQVHGFHGIWNTLTDGRADDYAEDGFDGPAAWAFMEQQTYWEPWSSDDDDICAVPMASAINADYAISQANSQTWSAAGNVICPGCDFKMVWGYTDCDPNAGRAFGSYW